MSDPIVAVLGPDFKKPFMVIVALCSVFILFFLGVRGIEGFIDGRIDMRLSAQRQITEDHEKRLTKIEEKLGSMGEVLNDIRADVKVLRAKMER